MHNSNNRKPEEGGCDLKNTEKIIARLEKEYPEALCALEYGGEGWKLLVLSRLSAQCTDKRVNMISDPLFRRYPTYTALAECDVTELEEIIRPCGLFRTKARDIKAACALLDESYGGILPDTIEALLLFPGVGRKIANLLVGDIYGKPAIVADTHCMRLAGRLGFCREDLKDPKKIEEILKKAIPESKQNDFCHRLVLHGRAVCRARNPDCANCVLSDLCAHNLMKH